MTNKFRDCGCEAPILKEKIKIKAGDYFEIDIFVTTTRGGSIPFNLTGSILRFEAKNDILAPTVTIEKTSAIPGEIVIMDAIGGHGRVILESADTLALGEAGGVLYYDVQLEDTEARRFTIGSGRLIFLDTLS